MNKNLKALELDKILKKLAEETAFADAQQSALQLTPANDLYTVNKLLKQTDDAYVLSGRFGSPSFGRRLPYNGRTAENSRGIACA